jgi:uncharacterized membrane protein YkvA (DUF1232 family)
MMSTENTKDKSASDPEQNRKLFSSGRLVLRLMSDRRVPALLKILPLVALGYVLSPIDLAPALAMGPLAPLGTLDDIGVLLLGLTTFIRMSPSNVVSEHRQQMSGSGGWHVEDEPTSSGDETQPGDETPPMVEGFYEIVDDDKK